MTSESYNVTCRECRQVTFVNVTTWPATRTDPPDGETSPEECPKCFHRFDQEDQWEADEPPEPDYDRDDGPYDHYDPHIDYPERYSDGPY